MANLALMAMAEGGGGAPEGQRTFQKKKKGKSFLQKAKKFGKQGQRGKGTEIAQDQYDYLVRVMERWRDGFETDEDKAMFVENVMEQTVGEERVMCGNQLASRVMELILPSAQPKVLSRFGAALSSDLRLACMDPFMSHVLEKLLVLRTFRKEGEQESLGEDDLSEAKDWVLKACKFVTNNLADFCQDTYASHILRTCTQCMVGKRFQEEKKQGGEQSKKTEGYDERTEARFGPQDPEMEEVLETLMIRILGMEPELLASELSVRVLQVYLRLMSSHQPKTARGVARHLLTVCYSDPAQVDWEDVSTVRLLECVIEVGVNNKKLGPIILTSVLGGRMAELAAHPVANFVVQRVVGHMEDKEQFTAILAEVGAEGRVEEILATGCTGVLLALAKATVRLETGQAALLTSLTAALHCTEHQDLIAPLLAHLVTREAWAEGGSHSVHLHGSLVLQQLLLYSKPIKVVRSLLALPPTQLCQLLADPRGSHVADTFLSSKSIGEKSREGLVKALRGEMVSLATSKHGSRTLDALWKYSGMKMKQSMVEELSGKLDILNSNKFGKFVAQKCLVSVFKRSKEDWRKLLDKEEKVEDMFTDILGDAAKAVKKRKAEEPNKAETEPVVPEKVAKTEVTTSLVDEWLKDDVKTVVKKMKKPKVKSYLDDL